ncbi:MAG TPA: DUF448 domain-containing protein [Desulfuromonadaceae bacterium]|jgi:hypothetical protein
MSRKSHEAPQRSCLGCRTARDKGQLIRFVLSPQGEVTPDVDAKLPGRGAYTCINSTCLLDACKQRQFNRAFKQDVHVPPPEKVVEGVAGLLKERVLGFLGLANRAGKIVSGGAMVSDAIRSAHKPGFVVIATDVSDVIGIKIKMIADVNSIPCVYILTKDEIGAILGKAPRSAFAVKSGGFVKELASVIKRYRNFLGEV